MIIVLFGLEIILSGQPLISERISIHAIEAVRSYRRRRSNCHPSGLN